MGFSYDSIRRAARDALSRVDKKEKNMAFKSYTMELAGRELTLEFGK